MDKLNDADEVQPFRIAEPQQDVGFSPLKRQLLAASPPVIAAISTGMVFGYSATLIPELQKPESDIQITQEIASWIASIVPLLMAIASLVTGHLMERYGRKRTQFMLCIPGFLGWILIYFAPNLIVLMAGRVIGGFSAGMHASLFPAYLGEISDPKNRGMIIPAPPLAMALGILLTHVSGTFLTWRTTALIGSFTPLLSLVMLSFVPDTPTWYISKNKYEKALQSFKWLRGESARAEFDETWEQHRHTVMNRALNENFWDKLTAAFKKSEFVKPSLIIFCCFFIMQFSGPYIVAFYSVSILEKTLGSTMDEYLVMNIIDVLRLVMVVIALILLRISRRRLLMLTSGIGTTLACFALAVFLLACRSSDKAKEHTWFPIVALVCYIFFVSIGIFVLPWCMAGELLPLDYRGLGTGLNVAFNYFLFFIIVKISPAIFDGWGMDGTFLFYGLVALLGTIILYFVMPETKNRTLVDIEKEFTRNNRRNKELPRVELIFA